jgi:enoyl-CoA hydratase
VSWQHEERVMGFETLTLSVTAGVATITLSRPQHLNALNRTMLAELDEALARIAADPVARVLVVTGAGERAFAAGVDIREFVTMDPGAALQFSRDIQQTLRRLERLPQPSIAMVNGFALGGGCELMMACSIAYAAATAKLGQPEIGLGLIPGAGGTQRLARLVGRQKAMELILTGDLITAEEACRIGLVCKVVAPDALAGEVAALSERIATKGAVALRMAKEAVEAASDAALVDGLELEAKSFSLCFTTGDVREGVTAFLEKRQPKFS